MKTKKEIQNELEDLKRQAAALAARRAALHADRDRITASANALTKAIGAAMLENRDAAKEADALARDRAKLEGVSEAITQADDKLADLKKQETEAIFALDMLECDRLVGEADAMLLKAVDNLKSALANLTDLDQKIKDIRENPVAKDYDDQNSNHVNRVYAMRNILSDDIKEKLRYALGEDEKELQLLRVKSGG